MFGNHAFSKYIIDKTPHDDFIASRGDQIEYWLKMNRGRFNVQSHVIFDDDDDEISVKFPNNFLRTKMNTLLTQDHVEKAFAILTLPVASNPVLRS